MDRKLNRFVKIYPWFHGLTADLLFYIAIDTLFLTAVKNLSAAQIVSLTTVSTVACILLQFPVLWLIHRIGNTASARISALLLLLSSLSITFGGSYIWVAAGRVMHGMAAMFHSVTYVALENNLELMNKQDDYLKVRTAGNTIYSIITSIRYNIQLMFSIIIFKIVTNINSYIILSSYTNSHYSSLLNLINSS